MKKLFVFTVLIMVALVINAQRTPVMVANLQKAITDNVAKDFPGFTIKEATKIVTNNVVTFDVVVVKGTTQETLLYDKDGKFIKKIVAREGTTAKSSTKMPAVKKTNTKPPVKK